MAEEQPVAARRFDCVAFVQEGAKRRDARSPSDHDDRFRRILGQREMLRLLHIDPDLVAGRYATAEKSRTDAKP
jgi:hypothetical protein